MILIIILFILSQISIANADDICVLPPIQAMKIEGYLLWGYKGNYRCLDDAKVDLYEYDDNDNIYRTTVVEKNGYFNIKDVKPGKYNLRGISEIAIPAWVVLEVIVDEDNKVDDKLIFIVLGADVSDVCGGSSITMEPKTKIEKFVKSALDLEKRKGAVEGN